MAAVESSEHMRRKLAPDTNIHAICTAGSDLQEIAGSDALGSQVGVDFPVPTPRVRFGLLYL